MWSSYITKTAALLAVLGTGSVVSGLGQRPIIGFNNSAGAFQIAGGSISTGQILVSSNDYWGVIRAAGDLALDFGRVTGTNYTLSNGVNASAPASYVYNPVNNKNNTVVSSRLSFLHCWRGTRADVYIRLEGPKFGSAHDTRVTTLAGLT